MARCSLHLCLVHPKLCGIFYYTYYRASHAWVCISLSLFIFMCVCECDFKKQKDEGKRGEEGMLVCVWIIYGGESVDVI